VVVTFFLGFMHRDYGFDGVLLKDPQGRRGG
jgi:hypothetical protein